MTNGASLNDQYIRTLILIKARSLMKSPAFRGVERDDVLRDLTLILAKRLGQFDPERAQLRTFVSRVLDSAAITLLRARQREKRSGDNGMASIERLRESQTTDPVTGSAAVGEADAARRLGREVRSPIDEFHLNDSIREIVAALPPDLADLCRALQEDSAVSTARGLGISRRQLRNRIAELRVRFAAAGFKPM
ncbi:MAG: sigma factor [Phycisphaerales bacterium]